MMKMNKLPLMMMTFLSAVAITNVASAKQVALFENPSDKAKVVGTVDLATGIIPIFTPKDSDWVKVADPRNGHVGWIKAKDLGANGSFSFQTKFLTDDDDGIKGSYKIIEFGSNNAKSSNKEMQARLERLQEQQINIQRSVNKSIQNMVNDMNQLYQEYSQMMNSVGMPVIMPVMIVPTSKSVSTQMGVGTNATKKEDKNKVSE